MSEPRPSGGTASNVAAYRAMESLKPANERLFHDPFAIRFLPGWQRVLVGASRLPALRCLVERYADNLAPGAGASAVARTRLIDDWLRKEIAAGTRQIVILGAGFDCRALRMSELAETTVFEIDRPRMIAYKTQVLADHPRKGLHRVPVDFLKDSLADRLLDAGYERGTKTVFIWEGVTNYLNEESVAAVFEFVANTTLAGSKIVFTYVHADAIAGRFDAPGIARLLAALKKRGEPWTFGFLPEALPAYLARHGMRLAADLGAADYRRLYWPTMPKVGIGYEFYHTALAEVTARAAR